MGDVSLRPGPGFATPLFSTETSNRLWLQSISEDDLISAFLMVEDDARLEIEHTHRQYTRRRGDKALYVYHDFARVLHVDTRDGLKASLYNDYTKISDLPYLRRSIARFIGDKRLLNETNEAIGQRERGRRRIETFNARFLDDGELARTFVRRHPIEHILSDALDGKNIILLGRRGDGKTTTLRFVQQELRARDVKTLYLSGSPSISLALSLTQKAAAELYAERGHVDIQEIETLVRQSSTDEIDQYQLSDRIRTLFRSIVDEMILAKRRTAILIDDFELFASQPNSTRDVLRYILEANIQFVLAGSQPPSDLGLLHNDGIFRTVNRYELGPLSADEVASLIQVWSHSRRFSRSPGLVHQSSFETTHWIQFQRGNSDSKCNSWVPHYRTKYS